MKRLVIAAMLSILMVSPVYGSTENCHKLVMSYILADQDKPSEPGDKFYSEIVTENNPILMQTTGYYQGSHGSHGDRMREGYAACAPEMYGCCVMVYEAVPQEDGTYKIGEYLDTFEIRDCGYGVSTGSGRSSVRSDKKYAGSIETGIHLDVYRDNLSRCREWMNLTGGRIFGVIVKGEG